MYSNNFAGNNRPNGCGNTVFLGVVGIIVFIVLVLLAGGSIERMPNAIVQAQTVDVANDNKRAINDGTIAGQIAVANAELEAQAAAIAERIRTMKAETDLAIANAFRDSHRANAAKDLAVYGGIGIAFFAAFLVILVGAYAVLRKITAAIQLPRAVAATAAAAATAVAPATPEPQPRPLRQPSAQERRQPRRETNRTVYTPLNLVPKSSSGRQPEPEPARPSPNGSNGYHGRNAIYEEHGNEWIVTYVNN